MSYKKGFTLIELLISVAIISILVSIGAASFGAAQRQARDAERKSDLGTVASALEQYYSDNNVYPEESSGLISCGGGLSWGSPFTCNSISYLSELPDDPTSSQDYYYEARQSDGVTTPCSNSDMDPTNDCQRFVVSTDLENDNDTDRDVANCQLTGTHDYCVTNP